MITVLLAGLQKIAPNRTSDTLKIWTLPTHKHSCYWTINFIIQMRALMMSVKHSHWNLKPPTIIATLKQHPQQPQPCFISHFSYVRVLWSLNLSTLPFLIFLQTGYRCLLFPFPKSQHFSHSKCTMKWRQGEESIHVNLSEVEFWLFQFSCIAELPPILKGPLLPSWS